MGFIALSDSLLVAVIFICVFVVTTPMVIDYHGGEVNMERHRQEWMKEYAIPFIEHLPDKKNYR